MFNHANDIDFYRTWVEVLTGGRTTVATTRRYCCLYAGRKTGRTYRLTHEEVLARFGHLIVQHERIDEVFSPAISNYGYVMRHPALGQEMTLRVYGHDGRPVVAFPTMNGRYWDFEGFGMVDACAGLGSWL